jgi:DNA adenine methylase
MLVRMLPFREQKTYHAEPFKPQLLKWVGNKQRFASEIISHFPYQFGTYFEPFLGAGGVLGTLAPRMAIASDSFKPLIEIWQTLKEDPDTLTRWYTDRWHQMKKGNKLEEYERIKAAYNVRPNGADLLFLCRSCYGGVVRFRQSDGWMSTPVGVHDPISPTSFAKRVCEWNRRIQGTSFLNAEYKEVMGMAKPGDMIYCDPPYSHSQSILYGAQSFSLEDLFITIAECKDRGVYVALSIDGTKRSGDKICELPIPKGLFEKEAMISCGRSMLKRFQMNGRSLEDEVVADRLLITYYV